MSLSEVKPPICTIEKLKEDEKEIEEKLNI